MYKHAIYATRVTGARHQYTFFQGRHNDADYVCQLAHRKPSVAEAVTDFGSSSSSNNLYNAKMLL